MSDFLFGIATGRPESFKSSTMSFELLNKDKSSEASGQNGGGSSNLKSSDFYPQFAGFGSLASIDEAINMADFRCFAFSFLMGSIIFLGSIIFQVSTIVLRI